MSELNVQLNIKGDELKKKLKISDGVDGKNGNDGKDGKNGLDGKNGYTPIKGVDFFDGKDGRDGLDGLNAKDIDGEYIVELLTSLQGSDKLPYSILRDTPYLLGKGGGGAGQTETDPIFTASVAFGITQADIDNWNDELVNNWWSRTGTTVTPANAGDDVNSTGNYQIDGTQVLKTVGDSLFVGDGGSSLVDLASKNTIVGLGSAPLLTGSRNSGLGYGVFEAATTATKNQAFGDYALSNLIDGTGNSAIGNQAMGGTLCLSTNYTTANGYQAGHQARGDYSLHLGYRSGYYNTRDYTLTIGDSYATDPLIYGEFDTGLVRINGAFNVTGNVGIELGGLLKVSDGTAAAPSITFTNDTKKGFYNVGTNLIGISINGGLVGSFYYTATDAGMSMSTYRGNVNVPMNFISRDNDAAASVGFVFDTSNTFTTAGSKLASFRTGTSEKAYIDYTGGGFFAGNVGIGTAPSSLYRLYNSANGTTIQTALVNSCVYSGTGQEATGSFNQVYSVGTHAAARGIGGRFAVIDYKLDRTSGSSTVYGGWFSTADRTGTFQAGASHSFQAGFFNVANATGDWTTNNPPVQTYGIYMGNTPTGYGSNHIHYSIFAPYGNNYFGGTLGIGGVDSSYKLYVNGTSNFTGVARFASDAYFGDDFKIHNTIVSGIEIMDVLPQTTQSMALRVIPGSSPSYSWAGETTASFLEFHKDSAGARRLMILAPTDTAAGYDIMTYGTTTPGPINFGYIVSSVKYDILSVTQDGIVANGTSILNGDVGINLLSGTSPGKALDIKGQLAFTVVAIPTTACTYTLSGTAGNVDDGVHRYKVSYYNAEGETGLSSVYLEATVVDKSTSGQVLLADIPVSPDPTVIGRRIYRGKAGGSTSSYYFLVDINDNTTTTYTDNTADAGLAAADSRNRDNFTAGAIYKNGSRYGFIGTNNFAMGLLSMSPTSDPTGYFNFALGGYALNNITSGSLNTAVGFYSLLNLETASNCVSVGSYSQYSNVSGYDNVSIGSSALRSVVSTKRNVAIGSNALYSTVTNYNVGIGFESGYSVNTGSGVVAMGYQALRSGTVCTGTVALGYVAGYSAAGLTANACTTTTNSVFIGMYSGLGSTTQRTNAIAIGYKAVVDADNTCVIGGAGADAVDILLTKNIYDRSDTYKIYFGAGDDMSIDYDGTQGNIKTDLVAPSDLHVDCGTDKTIVLDETVWDDLRTPISTAKAIPGKEPKEVAYKGGIVYEFEDGRDEGCAFNVQLPHDYKEGSDIEFHIHMLIRTSGAGIGAENVKWDFTHSWSNIGDAQPTETTVPATIDVQNDTEDTHYLKEITATITGTGKKISSMLICSLTRDVSVANNYTDDVLVMEVDFHYQIDTIGSRQEDSK